jgi:hypothetical protein
MTTNRMLANTKTSTRLQCSSKSLLILPAICFAAQPCSGTSAHHRDRRLYKGLERRAKLRAWLSVQTIGATQNWQLLARRAIAEGLFSRRAEATHVGNLLARAWRSLTETSNN